LIIENIISSILPKKFPTLKARFSEPFLFERFFKFKSKFKDVFELQTGYFL
jgi:hypothetical protein